jgi:hypothetical protein
MTLCVFFSLHAHLFLVVCLLLHTLASMVTYMAHIAYLSLVP